MPSTKLGTTLSNFYWISSDKDDISVLRLAKLIGVAWRTAYRLLGELRKAMGHKIPY